MSKKIRPVEGRTKEDFIEAMGLDMPNGFHDEAGTEEATDDQKGYEWPMRSLIKLVNADVCMSVEQMDTALGMMASPDGNTVSRLKVLQVATYLNGTRLECRDCFNFECTKRSDDPDARPEEVKKRLD